MAAPPTSAGRGRETRLLILILGVSVAALLLLAQLRFPEQPVIVAPTPSPLERLAARATYEELAGIMRDLERRLAPAVVVLKVSAGGNATTTTAQGTAPLGIRFVPAVRVRPDTAVAIIGPDLAVVAVEGSATLPAVRGRDAERGLVVVTVPALGDAAPASAASEWPAARYVALVDAVDSRLAVRPAFLALGTSEPDPLWAGPLIAPPPDTNLAPGTFVFALDGRLVAAGVLATDGSTRLAPAPVLQAAAAELMAGGPPAPGDLGVDVVPLSPALALATGARSGVVVSWVRLGGPADGVLAFGDVIERVDNQMLTSPRAFEARVRRAGPGTALTLSVMRQGQRRDVTVTAAAAAPTSPPRDPEQRHPGLGLALRTRPKAGAEVVRVASGTAAERAGLQPGDLVTHVDDRVAPTAADLNRHYARAKSGTRIMLGVTRATRHLVLVLEKP